MADEELEDEELEEGEGEGEQPKKKKGFKLGPNVIAILKNVLNYVIVALITIVISLIVSSRIAGDKTVSNETLRSSDMQFGDAIERIPIGADYTLDEMIINTSDEDRSRMVKCRIVISYDEENPQVLAELTGRKTQIHAEIRNKIGEKKYDEIRTTVKQRELKKELRALVQRIVGVDGIIDVFLKDFTVI